MSNFVEPTDSRHDDIMTVEEWLHCVELQFFTDDDGYGYGVKDGKQDPTISVWPSLRNIPEGATHINWFNK